MQNQHELRLLEKCEKLEKELVLKNRELEIEAALERVRSRSMAMHKSDELMEVIQLVYEQLTRLGLKIDSTNFCLNYKESDDFAFWTAIAGSPYPTEFYMPYFDHPWFIRFKEAKRKGLQFTADRYSFEEKNTFYSHFFKHAPAVTEERKKYILSCPGLALSQVYMNTISLLITNYEGIPFSDEENAVFKRIGNVFEQTYTRFLDLQKAEAQAREANIEASLERVRAKAMAMHSSKDIESATAIVFNELSRLGIDMERCGLTLMNKAPIAEIWSTPLSHENREVVNVITGYVDLGIHPILQQCYQDWREKKDLCAYKLVGEEVRKYYAKLEEQPEYKFPKVANYPNQQILNTFYLKEGVIFAYTIDELSVEAKDIIQKFTKVFAQTYTRFLEIQKAEAQAREAQIEAALERVRSRTMAMLKTDELQEVVRVVAEELKNTGVILDTWGAVICTYFQDSNDVLHWTAAEDPTNPSIAFLLPYFKDELYDEAWASKNRGDSYFAKVFSFEVKNAFFKHAFEHSDYRYLPDDYKKTILERESHGIAWAWANKSAIMIPSVQGDLPSVEEKEILIRFAKVFEQAYIRFLDIQKAEAQAREAQIEAALERVRSRTMAMRGSDELLDVATILFQQVKALGVPQWNCGFNIWEIGDKEFIFYPGSPDGIIFPSPCKIPLTEHPVFQRFDESRRRGDDLLIYEKQGEEQEGHYQYMLSLPGVGDLLQSMLDAGFEFPTFQIDHVANFAYGNLIFITYEHFPEMHNVFKRFAKVFEQTYTRFLDLQKAEAQAREAQVETALERVRSRTMGMQRSDELAEVATLLFQQVKALGVPQWTCGFCIFEIDDKDFTWYPGGPNDEILPPCKIPLTEHPVFVSFNESRKRGDELFVYEKEGEFQAGHYRYMLSLPIVGDWLQSQLDAGISFPDFQIDHVANFAYGNLTFITFEHFPEMHNVFKRFAKVFEQTYTRFLDLQKAEAQAQEVIKRASVDRVRAEIASMRTKGDLERIQPLIWNELKILRVPFIRCGVFIMDEVKQDVQVFLSTPDGKSIAAFRLPYNATEQSKQIVTHWQKKQLYKDHMDEASFSAYTKNLVQQGAMAGNEKYVTENRPTDLYLHFLPFLQGMLYVGNEAPLKEDELQLVQNLADAFSTAYARYEDFVKLEKAKAEVESAMTELKATQSQLVQQEKLASLGQLTAGIAHEIKNPLNFVNNFSEVSMELIEEALEEIVQIEDNEHATESAEILCDIKSNLKKIHEHGTRANTIVTSMLQHSRGGSGKKEPTDLNALIKEYVNLSFHGMRAGKNPINVDIVLDLDPEIKEVSLIKEDFTRVIINLCNNAFDALKTVKTQRAASLRVRTKKHLDTITIEIEDNGPGIPDEIKDKILQPFFTTKKGTEGTGLGLSITHDIVKAHGGELTLDSNEEVGTQFTIKIPIA